MTEKEKAQLRRKWRGWLKKIGNDLGDLLTSNEVFKELGRIVEDNKNIQSPALLHDLIFTNFAHSVAIGIRRLNDQDKRSISLYRLIMDISEHRDVITRKYYISTYRKWMRQNGIADRDFDLFANKNDEVLSAYKLKRDWRKLKNDSDRIKKFVDKWVAHSDLKQRRYKIPTFKDVDNVLNDIDQLFCKYYLLLKRGGLDTCKPILQFDWRKPLRYAWLPTELKEENQ